MRKGLITKILLPRAFRKLSEPGEKDNTFKLYNLL